MRIAIDVSPLSRPRTGIGNYLRQLLAGLASVCADEHELVAFAPASRRGAREIRASLSGLPVEQRVRSLPLAHAWRTAWSRAGRPPVESFLGRIDVFHFSDWMYPPQRNGVRATTIHDLVPIRFPTWVTRETRRMHLAKLEHTRRRCDVVFCVSRFTADDVTSTLGITPDRVRVAYPAVDSRFHPTEQRQAGVRPYVVSVGTFEPRKNLETLVRAVRSLREQRPELELVIAGADGWGDAVGRDVPGVRLLGYVTDTELANLYRGAAVACYPSLFEGFGLPVVEAMASGIPVVVSNHPSLDEASGDVATRVDPLDPDAIAAGIEDALAAPESHVLRGVAHAAQFSPEACAHAVLAGYEEIRA